MRLLAVSFGIMLLGFAAVVVTVLYRISQDRAPTAVTPVTTVEIAVDPADVIAASATDGRLVLTIGGAAPRVEVRRLEDGALTHRFDLAAPAGPAGSR